MDIPSERNMKFKWIAKMGNYQKYLLFYKERRKILCVPNSSCLSTQSKETKVTAHQADTVLVLTSCWDYLKHILHQKRFYLLQASKNSTNLSCRWTLSWEHKHIAFNLKTHTASLHGSGIKLSESPNTRPPFCHTFVSILEILESCFYLNVCIPILIAFVSHFVPIIIFILHCV